MSERRQLFARLRVAQLRFVAQGQERLLAAGGGTPPSGLEYLLLGQEGSAAFTRLMGEGAIAADVAAELRQRDEDLAGIGDDVAEAFVPQLRRARDHVVERAALRQVQGSVGAEAGGIRLHGQP